MSDFSYQQDGTGVEWKYQPSEDRMYVRKYATNYNELAEKAKQVRNDGGTKEKGGFRMVATIPTEVFVAANDGRSHNGRYRGFLSGDADTQQKMLSKFFLEDDVKPFLLNDNFKV